jgi:hypothetical protein
MLIFKLVADGLKLWLWTACLEIVKSGRARGVRDERIRRDRRHASDAATPL